MKSPTSDHADNERRKMIHKLAEKFRKNGVTIHAAVELDELPLPKLFPNPGFGDQRRKQPHILGVHEESGELYIGLVKTQSDDLTDESALTEYDLFMDLTIRQKGIRFCLMMHEDRIQHFNSFITHYLHPDFWPNMMVVAYSEDA